MIGLKEEQDLYLAQFQKFAAARTGEPAWLNALRKKAMERFAELGLPSTHLEDWKYTNVSALAKPPFQLSQGVHRIGKAMLEREPLAKLQCGTRLVFVNGRHAPELSAMGSLPAGVRVHSLADALRGGDGRIESHLARYASFDNQAFVALNTAFVDDGAVIEVPKGTALEEPVLVVFVSAGGEGPVMAHPRNLYLVGRGSQAAFIESYISLGEGARFTNVVSEVVAGDGAVVEHYKLQAENLEAFHVATVQALQERASAFVSHNVSLGAALARNDINVLLDGEGAECHLNGLFAASGRQHVDNHTALDHARPYCPSREMYKGILDGQSTGVFNGKILVRKEAQKTNALQSNKNLLLSAGAAINTKPQLEIYADDVRCTHGATVGQIDQDALFYMRTRGISREAARDLLTHAFAADVLEQMKWVTARSQLEQLLYRKLSGGRPRE